MKLLPLLLLPPLLLLLILPAHTYTFTLTSTLTQQPVLISPTSPSFLLLGSRSIKPSTFTFTTGNVTSGTNLYLHKETKYSPVFSAEVGEIPWGPYIFFDTWTVSGDLLRAKVWGDVKEKQWFTCPGRFGERVW
jgi:hypothetical protein